MRYATTITFQPHFRVAMGRAQSEGSALGGKGALTSAAGRERGREGGHWPLVTVGEREIRNSTR